VEVVLDLAVPEEIITTEAVVPATAIPRLAKQL